MPATIYFITGGERSGKSSYAQKLALSLGKNPVYLATARVWDDDFRARIERHKADRDENWENIEEEINIAKHNFAGKVVLLDCITLWLTNIFADNGYDPEKSIVIAKAEWDKFIQQNFTVIVVTNEIGMGGHAATEAHRNFTSLQGWMNQYIATKADKAIMMVSGMPLTLK
jgi:adenosylcobinamide kinase/adenosylcobinamide-phosphate guanylyltransferase